MHMERPLLSHDKAKVCGMHFLQFYYDWYDWYDWYMTGMTGMTLTSYRLHTDITLHKYVGVPRPKAI